MLTGFDHVFALALAVFFPIRAATFGYRRLVEAAEADVPRVRTALYGQAMAIQWGLAAALAGLWLATSRPAQALGLRLPETTLSFVICGTALALGLLLLLQAQRARRSPETLERAAQRFEHVERMLPHTPDDLRRFRALSITAGICEELLYRGYLIWYFGHWLPPLGALAASSLLFGLGHSYQGPRGVVLTGIVGLILGGAYLAAGTLFPVMWLHAAGDLQAGTIAQASLARRPQAAGVSPGG